LELVIAAISSIEPFGL